MSARLKLASDALAAGEAEVRLVWLLLSASSAAAPGAAGARPSAGASSELLRVYHQHGAALHALPPALKAVAVRALAGRALAAGARAHEPGASLGLADARAGGVALAPGARGARGVGDAGRVGGGGGGGGGGGDAGGGAVAPEAAVVANLFLSSSGAALTELKRLVDHPPEQGAEGARGAATGAVVAGPSSTAGRPASDRGHRRGWASFFSSSASASSAGAGASPGAGAARAPGGGYLQGAAGSESRGGGGGGGGVGDGRREIGRAHV